MGFFGNVFDFNGDGKLDASEQAMEFMFLAEMMEKEEKASEDENAEDEYFEDEDADDTEDEYL